MKKIAAMLICVLALSACKKEALEPDSATAQKLIRLKKCSCGIDKPEKINESIRD